MECDRDNKLTNKKGFWKNRQKKFNVRKKKLKESSLFTVESNLLVKGT